MHMSSLKFEQNQPSHMAPQKVVENVSPPNLLNSKKLNVIYMEGAMKGIHWPGHTLSRNHAARVFCRCSWVNLTKLVWCSQAKANKMWSSSYLCLMQTSLTKFLAASAEIELPCERVYAMDFPLLPSRICGGGKLSSAASPELIGSRCQLMGSKGRI